MSLTLANKPSIRQLAELRKLNYYGTLNISAGQANCLLTELWEERRLEQVILGDQSKHDIEIIRSMYSMSLLAKETGDGTDFEIVPEDVYTARCYRILDLGTQQIEWQGKVKEQHKVMISWELIGDQDPRMTKDDNAGKPFSIHKRYTVTLDDRGALRADLEAWRGKKFTDAELEGFDLSKILGQYCTIQVVHSDDGKYANVSSIMVYKGEKPKAVNPDVVFDIDEPNMEVFDSLSENLQKTIQKAPEWHPKTEPNKEAKAKNATIEDVPDTVHEVDEEEPINLDDIPF